MLSWKGEQKIKATNNNHAKPYNCKMHLFMLPCKSWKECSSTCNQAN